MSRRKQAKPRALKPGIDWDGGGMSPDSDAGAAAADDDKNVPEASSEQHVFRCQSCGLAVASLKGFMDHRNFDCIAGAEESLGGGSATHGDPEESHVAMETENSLESAARTSGSDVAAKGKVTGGEAPSDTADDRSMSPPSSSGATPSDPDVELNFTVGVTEVTPYACQFCERAFPRLSYLKRHEQGHGDRMPFKCDFCHRLFKHKRSRDRHVKLHTGDRKYRCPHCDAAFSRSDHLKIHMKTHDTAKPFQCSVCNRGYNTAAALTSHMQSHKRCMHCTATFPSAQQLQDHVAVHTSGSSSPDVASAPSLHDRKCSEVTLRQHVKVHASETAPPGGDAATKTLSCSFCTKNNFVSAEVLQAHVRTMHEASNGGGGESSSPSPPLAAPLSCEYCTMKLSSIQALQKHTLSVHSFTEVLANGGASVADYVTCPHCMMGFGGSHALAEHVQSVHEACKEEASSPPPPDGAVSTPPPPPGTLLCSQCSAALPDFEAFRTHLKSHLDEVVQKQHVCSECRREFASEEQLDSHVTGHFLSTATEYGCQSCLKLFAKPDELQKHLMDIHAHHLYRCALCSKVFDSRVSVQVHFAVRHSNECRMFKCTSCASVFRSESEFALHVKVAHLRRAQPFRCLFCHFSYQSELELQCHLTTHRKQFACSLCDDAFHVEFLLDRHMQQKHAAAPEASASEAAATAAPPAAPAPEVAEKETKKKAARCDICDAEFAGDVALHQHRRLAHNVRQKSSHHQGAHQILSLHCAYCNESCKSRTELETHMKVQHSANCGAGSKNKCNICDELCPTAAILAEHKLTHCKVVSGSTCVVCKVSLKSEDQYYSHLQQHNSQGLPLPCVVCRQTLMSEVEVQMHVKFHLKNAEPLFPCCVCLEQHELANLVPSTSGGAYVCKQCFHQSPQGGEARRCAECKVKFESAEELEQHRSAAHKKTYQCIKCQRSFDTESEIQLHVASHVLHEGTSHECRLCHKVFDSPAKLQCHLIEHTFDGCSSYTCYMCSAVYTTAALLQQHMLEHGLHSRPYDCGHCHQRFFFRAELDNHAFNHDASATAKRFASTARTRCRCGGVRHAKNRSSCESCRVASAKTLRRHLAASFDLSCPVCGDSFASAKSLQRHLQKTHATDDPTAATQSDGDLKGHAAPAGSDCSSPMDSDDAPAAGATGGDVTM